VILDGQRKLTIAIEADNFYSCYQDDSDFYQLTLQSLSTSEKRAQLFLRVRGLD